MHAYECVWAFELWQDHQEHKSLEIFADLFLFFCENLSFDGLEESECQDDIGGLIGCEVIHDEFKVMAKSRHPLFSFFYRLHLMDKDFQ